MTTFMIMVLGVADGNDVAKTAQHLAAATNRSQSEVESLLQSKKPTVVKRGLDYRTATKYGTALESAGCLYRIEVDEVDNGIGAPEKIKPPTSEHAVARGNPHAVVAPPGAAGKRIAVVGGVLALVGATFAVWLLFLRTDNQQARSVPPPTAARPIERAPAAQAPKKIELAGSDQAAIRAGKLQVTDAPGGSGRQVKLNGQIVPDTAEHLVSIEYVLKRSADDVALISKSSGGTACPAMYQLVGFTPEGKVAFSHEFGSCSDQVLVQLHASGELTIAMARADGKGETEWKLAGNLLTSRDSGVVQTAGPEQKPQDLNVNAPEMHRVTGQVTELVRGGQKQQHLKLSRPLKIVNMLDDKQSDFHHGEVLGSVPLNLGDPSRFPAPKQGTSGDFMIRLTCSHAECAVSELSIGASQASTAAVPGQTPGITRAPDSSTAATRPSQMFIRAGSIICGDMYGMNKVRAIAAAGNPSIGLPDSCIVMKRDAPTRILRESTPIPGVVVIEAGQSAAMVDRNDLGWR